MSSYKCQLCCLAFKSNADDNIVNVGVSNEKSCKDTENNLLDKYQCECGNTVCGSCVQMTTSDKNKCNLCAGLPVIQLDADYDCVCEICKQYDSDGYPLRTDKHGLQCYMCSCCMNGCAEDEDEYECRCIKRLCDDQDSGDEGCE
jgi:hypothetical protein